VTIEKGQDWGGSAELPPDAPIVSTDAQLADLFTIATDGSVVGPAFVGLRSSHDHDRNPADLAKTVSARAMSCALISPSATASRLARVYRQELTFRTRTFRSGA